MNYTQLYSDLYHYSAYRGLQINGWFLEDQLISSTCHLTLWQSDTETLVMVTELAANEGMSVTNAAGWLATKVIQDYQLSPERTRFVEHYGKMSYANSDIVDTYDLVTFSWNEEGEACNPKWRRLTKEEVTALPSQAV